MALINLIGNAVEAVEGVEGGVTVTWSVGGDGLSVVEPPSPSPATNEP